MKVEKQWVFDTEFTRGYTKVRQNFIAAFLESIHGQVALKSAIDVGAGVGYFTAFLQDLGFDVVGVDGRVENVAEAQRRNPGISFIAQDVESGSFAEVGKFDLVLCVGLLYHLENPFRAIRNLNGITHKLLVLESICVPGDFPSMELLDEAAVEDQALNFVAFYPTEICLIKMLYRAGFPQVYAFKEQPNDSQFVSTLQRRRSRTFLVASRIPLTSGNLLLAPEPLRRVMCATDPWTTPWARLKEYRDARVFAAKELLSRALKPWRRKASSS